MRGSHIAARGSADEDDEDGTEGLQEGAEARFLVKSG